MVTLFYNCQEPVWRETYAFGIAKLTGTATAALTHDKSEVAIRGKDLHAMIEAVGDSNASRPVACAAKFALSIESDP